MADISVLNLFTIGIGPSSSHTVGPMRAGRRFVESLQKRSLLTDAERIEVRLYASLALTGKGHGTDVAVLLGLEGETPEGVDIDGVTEQIARIRHQKTLQLSKGHEIDFDEATDLLFLRKESLPAHPNGLTFTAYDKNDAALLTKTYYSVGGGFLVGQQEADDNKLTKRKVERPFPYRSGDDLLKMAAESQLSISEMTLRNEACFRPEKETLAGLSAIWQAMEDCIARGCQQEGILPGGLKVKRRAPELYARLKSQPLQALADPLAALDWVSLWAIAVNEENAAGGRVVTAPTNGAAGIIPAALQYLVKTSPEIGTEKIGTEKIGTEKIGTEKIGTEKIGVDKIGVEKIQRFLLTAGAIGILYKLNASISGAEVGCQGEVGVACSMAAAALCEAWGGTVPQVENAAEIGMEHNLGLTCDPIGGLVQVPCIERNAMGAVKAINAARLALCGDGNHRVSLDKVIRTMRQTGADMSAKYKETSRGGLAVNVTEC